MQAMQIELEAARLDREIGARVAEPEKNEDSLKHSWVNL